MRTENSHAFKVMLRPFRLLVRRHQVELEQTKHGHRLLVEVGLIEAD